MAGKRKLWSTVTRGHNRRNHGSKAAAYRYVQRQASLLQDGTLIYPYLPVYVDERDSKGWQLYERVNLQDIVDSWTVTT